MTELLHQTISQIVTDYHQTAPVFEKYGIDYCCKGRRPLEAACQEKALNKDELLAELNQAIAIPAVTTDFNAMSLSGLADHIVRTHHAYVKANMPQIGDYIYRVATKHGDRFPYMRHVYMLFTEMQQDLTQHMLKEERILFPRIKRLETLEELDVTLEYFSGPIDIMEEEHELAGEIMNRIRELTGNYTVPAGACTTFRLSLAALQAFEADLHQHVHLENHLLFPKALERYHQLKPSLS